MNPNRPARLNRAVLAGLGLITLAAGAFVLLAGTGILRTIVPISPDSPLISTAAHHCPGFRGLLPRSRSSSGCSRCAG